MTSEDNLTIYLLTCADQAEAQVITNALLAKHLVACVKTVPVSSTFRWQGKIDSTPEVLLLLESRADKFQDIETLIGKLHSHKTFVLVTLPISLASQGVKKWIDESLV